MLEGEAVERLLVTTGAEERKEINELKEKRK